MANLEKGVLYLRKGISKKTNKEYAMLITPIEVEGQICEVILNVQNSFERLFVKQAAREYPAAVRFSENGNQNTPF